MAWTTTSRAASARCACRPGGMVERGVRFVQIFHGSNGGAGAWDAHSGLRNNHAAQCAQVDRPIAGLAAPI